MEFGEKCLAYIDVVCQCNLRFVAPKRGINSSFKLSLRSYCAEEIEVSVPEVLYSCQPSRDLVEVYCLWSRGFRDRKTVVHTARITRVFWKTGAQGGKVEF